MIWPFNKIWKALKNQHITWELPWKKPRPENCDSGADWDMKQYDFDYPHYKVMGDILCDRGNAPRGWVGHTEIWGWPKGDKLPGPIGYSLFCIYFRNKSRIDLVQLYNKRTKKPMNLPSEEEARVRAAVIKSKNKWRWF